MTDSCWRCGGAPHDFGKLKPNRPVCSVCAVELIYAALDDIQREETLEQFKAKMLGWAQAAIARKGVTRLTRE